MYAYVDIHVLPFTKKGFNFLINILTYTFRGPNNKIVKQPYYRNCADIWHQNTSHAYVMPSDRIDVLLYINKNKLNEHFHVLNFPLGTRIE